MLSILIFHIVGFWYLPSGPSFMWFCIAIVTSFFSIAISTCIPISFCLLTTPPLWNPPCPQGVKVNEASPSLPMLLPQVTGQSTALIPDKLGKLKSYPFWKIEWIMVMLLGGCWQHELVKGLSHKLMVHDEDVTMNKHRVDLWIKLVFSRKEMEILLSQVSFFFLEEVNFFFSTPKNILLLLLN